MNSFIGWLTVRPWVTLDAIWRFLWRGGLINQNITRRRGLNRIEKSTGQDRGLGFIRGLYNVYERPRNRTRSRRLLEKVFDSLQKKKKKTTIASWTVDVFSYIFIHALLRKRPTECRRVSGNCRKTNRTCIAAVHRISCLDKKKKN